MRNKRKRDCRPCSFGEIEKSLIAFQCSYWLAFKWHFSRMLPVMKERRVQLSGPAAAGHLAKSQFLDPFLLEATLPFWYQLKTLWIRIKLSLHSFSCFQPSIMTAFATALLLQLPPACLPLPWLQLWGFTPVSSVGALHCNYPSCCEVRIYLP